MFTIDSNIQDKIVTDILYYFVPMYSISKYAQYE